MMKSMRSLPTAMPASIALFASQHAARTRTTAQHLLLVQLLSSNSTQQQTLSGGTRSFSSSSLVSQSWSSGGFGGGSGGSRSPWGSSSSGSGSSRSSRRLPSNLPIKFVPQQEAWVVERMGRFSRILEPGLAILVPFLDRVRYVKVLKEVAVEIPSQSAITQDNVTLDLDGVLYYKVVDPYKASYGVEDHEYAIQQLAQTTMRAEIGQMTLDKTLAERSQLNENIVQAINHAADSWGIRCLRYEIRDIHPPDNVVNAMHQQVSAERRKRAEILESEGARQAAINVAEGRKRAIVLESEGNKEKQINQAAGDAEAILLRANATASSISKVSLAISQSPHGKDAVSLSVADKYVESFAAVAKESTTLILPGSGGASVASAVAEALAVFEAVAGRKSGAGDKGNGKVVDAKVEGKQEKVEA